KAKMNVSSVKTKDYEKNDIFSVPQNKANSKPIQSQSNPTCSELVEPISNHPRAAVPQF
ncbi:unnamed protein product, partial [marine sediment metagenome]